MIYHLFTSPLLRKLRRWNLGFTAFFLRFPLAF
nr:MAG TPA: hypothetical protein [Caudoviricetes sp.]